MKRTSSSAQEENKTTIRAQNIDCFDSFNMSYRNKSFKQEIREGDWKEVSGKREDEKIIFNDIQLKNPYQIKITAYTIHGSGKLLIFDSIESNSALKHMKFECLTYFLILLSCSNSMILQLSLD